MKETNLEEVKKLAINFLYLDITYHEKLSFVMIHPIFEMEIVGMPNGEILNIKDEENLKKAREIYKKIIEEATDLTHIMMIIRAPYQLTFLKFAKPYLSVEDFTEWLAHCWVSCENPNQDNNVSIKEFISWFKKADKKKLMNEEDYKYYSELPEEVLIYRGVAVRRAERKGLSWTDKYETAKWFAERFDNRVEGQHGYILKAKIRKEDIFAYFNTRGEDELVCNSSKIYDVERMEGTKND